MTLAPGTRLGAYEIVAPLGAGGMGAVYQARDTKLGRAVAIKVILDEFASNVERVGRFEREAKMLAALHHQRIASLFGMEHADGQHFLVMELVDGETLAERLCRGAIPVEEALPVAIQIAEALEAAHEKGVVHRDLKPANVKLTRAGDVKVLDFGLAKVMENESSAGSAANSPTLSMMATQAGLILGTAAYMSPEQAKGFPADHRSDIFSFGIVLCEMLTGRTPFQGETAPDILASILAREPDVAGLPAGLNPRLVEVVRRCLEKHPKKRWQAIGDVRAELESIALAPRSAAALAPLVRPLWMRAVTLAGVAIVAGAVAGTVAWRLKPQPPPPVYRFSVSLAGQAFVSAGRQILDVAPTGDRLAYVAANHLFVRHLAEPEGRQLFDSPNSRIVTMPRFSADGQSLAFYSTGDQVIKTVSVNGGTPVTVGRVDLPLGISWLEDALLVGQGPSGIIRLPLNGGAAETIVKMGQLETAYGPEPLPGGEHVLFTLGSGGGAYRWGNSSVVVQSIRSGARKILIPGGSDVRYLSTGHIVYLVEGVAFAARFDQRRLEIVGRPVPILEGILRAPAGSSPASQFAFSRNGVMAYIVGPTTGASDRDDLTLVDRRGVGTPLKLPPGAYESPRVYDGRRIAFGKVTGSEVFILVYDLDSKTLPRRLTFRGKNRYPIWTADGKTIVFQSDRDGDLALFVQQVDGQREAQRLTKPSTDEEHIPDDCSAAGVCLFTIRKGLTYTLSSVSLADGRVTPVSSVPYTAPGGARFSPDGRWVAYAMRDPLTTIVVEPFPPVGGTRFQMLPPPGDVPHHPLWSPDGGEILFNPRPNGFAAVRVTTSPGFEFGPQRDVPRNFRTDSTQMRANYDMMPDGRILGLLTPLEQGGAESAREIRVVVNWFEELKGKLPK